MRSKSYVWIVHPKRIMVAEGGLGVHEDRFAKMFRGPIHYRCSLYDAAEKGYAWKSARGIVTVSNVYFFNWRDRYRHGWMLPDWIRHEVASKIGGRLSKLMQPFEK